MPKPTLPPHAGPYQPAYSQTTNFTPADETDAASCPVKTDTPTSASEIKAETNSGDLNELYSFFVQSISHPTFMVWLALAFLGFGTVFAIYAIVHHG